MIAAARAATSTSTDVATAWRGDVRERFAQRREKIVGDRARDLGVDRTVEDDTRLERQRPGGFAGNLEDIPAQGPDFRPRRLDVEDHRPDVTDGQIELLDRGLDPAARLVLADQPGRPLQREPRREESLDDRVVQVTRDAFLILQAATVDGGRRGYGPVR